MPAVSVIIPAHNAAPFLEESVGSALAQTFSDLEVIVVNDGSTDDTSAVLARFNDRIRILEQARGGPGKARNLGASVAGGTWLAFLDADDVWLPAKLERQLALADEEADLLYTDRYNIGARGPLPDIQSDIQYMFEGHVFLDLLLRGNVITTSSVLVRRGVFHSLGGFSEDPDVPPVEDWDLWVRLAAEHRVKVCREPLVKYRFHPLSASQNPDRMNRARLRVTESVLQLPRAQALSAVTKRRIRATTWAMIGWDAGRHSRASAALAAYARSIQSWPFDSAPYKEMVKILVGRE